MTENAACPTPDASLRLTSFSHGGGCGCKIAPGGYSTLERHEHMHGVLILRGSGHCLVGDEVKSLGTNDLVTVPPMAWHQFRATKGEPLGFLCMVNAQRDKPQLPTADDLAQLKADPKIAAFLES